MAPGRAPDTGLLLPLPQVRRRTAETWAPEGPIALVADPLPSSDAEVDRRRWRVLRQRLERALGRLGLDLDRAQQAPRPSPTDEDGADEDGAGDGNRIRFVGSGNTDAGAGADRDPLGNEGHRITVGPRGVTIEASTLIGWVRGARTLAQWIEMHRVAPIQGLRTESRPDFPNRGLMLDISRNRVPRMRELERLVEHMAELGLGQLQLYTEHTFAYRGHEKVWRSWSPMEPDEIRHLDAYARDRCIELVPNQNSFGHFHRWLIHQPYRQLAECPDGIDHPFSRQPEPFGLCPTDPGSLELLDDLYSQLLPCFESGLFNVGLDETLDLGCCRSRESCEARGTERVYLDFLHQVHEKVVHHGRRLMFWGDIILKRPELIDQLPEDAIALEWGYEPDHPFAEDCARFAASGRDFYVCPGTGSWSSFGGRLPEAVYNLASAARHGRRHGAAGYLVTDWGDHGHLQPPCTAWPGLVAGAAFAWNAELAEDPDTLPLRRLLARHGVGPRIGGSDGELAQPLADALADVLVQLGEVHGLTGARSLNGSALFYTLHFAELPADERRAEGMSVDHLDRTLEALDGLAERCAVVEGIDNGEGVEEADLLVDELEWVVDVLRFAARFARGRLELGPDRPPSELPAALRQDLLARLDGLAERLPPLWLARSRPGGLGRSIERLLEVRPLLIPTPDNADQG